MGKDKKRILIIGQGLAGTILALQLIEKNQDVTIVRSAGNQGSSWVAGGIINPITGRKMVKTWNADILFPELKNFYSRWETGLGIKFLYDRNIYRPFPEMSDLNDWLAKYDDDEYSDYIENVERKPLLEDLLINPFGGLMLKNSGYLDIPQFLMKSREYLNAKAKIIESEFSFDDVAAGQTILWNGLEYDSIILCRGAVEKDSSVFGWLPFRPNKGEVLTVSSDIELDFGVTKGKFFMPIGNGKYRLGATYDNHYKNEEITEEAKSSILEGFSSFMKLKPKVEEQKAGIRPATKDRRPIVGKHPELNNVFILNGLGAKGVSLAPWCAKELINLILENKPVEDQVNINRFFSLLM
ncbi:NAD(P)/FAD-dependent oxidoreductase [Marinigracilibium pacificum]|uniref:FAD-binding oxidoreductase n=1 Tax=Marinigracilibium pacificum TaxID=2729599 RepID=A0A848IZ81_9BACT|nr:FAD-dependent oxidoreductase [Marinigracilibium pacificum]NMM48671.1 FAD-binding oxidoreductase [Marinigracilibium pacificum]